MLRVIDIIRRLLPSGTVVGRRTWQRAPFWPPDLFAVTATLAHLSGCYSRARYTAHWVRGCVFDSTYPADMRRIGDTWDSGMMPDEVQRLWSALIGAGTSDLHGRVEVWSDAAMKLMAIADEASAGIGFVTVKGKSSALVDYLYQQHRDLVLKRRPPTPGVDLPYLPFSLCWLVPPSEACVQPKARTAQVGCTLRSLSHHLALLPPAAEITTSWMFGAPSVFSEEALNLLLVPFPFRIDGGCFVGSSQSFGQGDARFFDVQQRWLRIGSRKLSAEELGDFFVGIVREALKEVRQVDGLILPEAALDESEFKPLARQLARRTDLELLIAGGLALGRRNRLPQNSVYTSIFHNHHILLEWKQAKHHRWRLDRQQIRRYHLGDALDPEKMWWERIELQPRTCTFSVFRHGACLTALVCEDLARIDPVQFALRAIGPNLVIVLLMDGPQRQARWPGRYATVLADDPGSAVLTLTCLGMARRAAMPGEEEPREIALWKEADGTACELQLPQGSHALLLTLRQSDEENYALDGRSDNGGTVRLSLSGIRGIEHPSPPGWVD